MLKLVKHSFCDISIEDLRKLANCMIYQIFTLCSEDVQNVHSKGELLFIAPICTLHWL